MGFSGSYSTIYRAIKTDYMEPKKKDGRYFMECYLRRKGWRGKKEKQEKAYIHCGIEEHPKFEENRSCVGHFEGDFVYSSCHKLYTGIQVFQVGLLSYICKS